MPNKRVKINEEASVESSVLSINPIKDDVKLPIVK